jgi:hypothetical protein
VITGPLTSTISHEGILAVYEKLSSSEKDVFKAAYCASYMPARDIIEVSGRPHSMSAPQLGFLIVRGKGSKAAHSAKRVCCSSHD